MAFKLLALCPEYGDINQDGVIDERDVVLLTKIIGYTSHTVAEMRRCDLDMNGVIAQNDLILLNRAIANVSDTSVATFRQYSDQTFGFSRDTTTTVNFGRKVVNAVFTVPVNAGEWTLYIDGVLYKTTSLQTLTVPISGAHTVKVTTHVPGVMTIKFPDAKL